MTPGQYVLICRISQIKVLDNKSAKTEKKECCNEKKTTFKQQQQQRNNWSGHTMTTGQEVLTCII